MKKIVVAHFNSVILYPPVLNLLENLLHNGYDVSLISVDITFLPEKILSHPNLEYTDIVVNPNNEIIDKVERRLKLQKEGRRLVKKYMENADILWTTTDRTVQLLKGIVNQYKHVMQLMELVKEYPYYNFFPYFKFPIEKYARSAWKVVVPEINRAYIQQVWWNLPRTPCVLPNKPYVLEPGEPESDMVEALECIKKERKKVILYLGVIGRDRSFDTLVKALEQTEEYCLYIVGKSPSGNDENFYQWLSLHKNVKYLGYFKAPKHLLFLQYAYIGLLPYSPTKQIRDISELNALYCAPNKIFEYSGYGIPMLGSDVLGLKLPFERYNIGACYLENENSILESLEYINKHYQEMSKNCCEYFKSYDLDEIVSKILED